MKIGDKVQLRRRISQKGGKSRLATEKVTILGIYPHHVQVRNQKGIVRSYINKVHGSRLPRIWKMDLDRQ